MKVSAEDVKHIAQLSRLTVPASEMEVFTEQFHRYRAHSLRASRQERIA